MSALRAAERVIPAALPVTTTADPGFVRELSNAWLAVGISRFGPRRFVVQALCFATLLWGALGRGGFFRSDLIVFTVLALLTAASVPRFWRVVAATPELAWSAAAVMAAIGVSAVVRGQLSDAPYALAPVAAAVALALAGVSADTVEERVLLRRIVVDVATITAILGVVGVALHLPRYAELQAEGWRASAGLGYANATGLLLVFGLLCAAAAAAMSGTLADKFRCWLIAFGLLATQSRGAVLALLGCGVVLLLLRRPIGRAMAGVLAESTAWALVAFIGLLPAVERVAPQPGIAAAGAVVAVVLMIALSSGVRSMVRRGISTALGVFAIGIVLVLLNTRVADAGSNDGRLRLWRDGIDQLHRTGVFGAGPGELAEFSRGNITQIFDHNDVLQYAQYYGVLGVIALGVVGLLLGRAFAATRATGDVTGWAVGLGAALAIALVAVIDFPLQIPVLTATAALLVATAVVAPSQSPVEKGTS